MALIEQISGERLFDQRVPGVLWDSTAPYNAETLANLRARNIPNIYTCSTNILRTGIGEQLAEALGATHGGLITHNKEVTLQQYKQAVGAGLFPNVDIRGYQLLVSGSKLERIEEIEQLPDGIVLVNDTFIVPAPGDTMEKAVFGEQGTANEREVERQLQLISSGRPYLITNAVMIFGTGKYYGQMVNVPFAIPVRMKVNQPGGITSEELYQEMRQEYQRDNHAPRFPGVISHMNPILQRRMQVALARNLAVHAELNYDDFFRRPPNVEYDADPVDIGKVYGDDGAGNHNIHVRDKLISLTWHDFETLLDGIKHKIGSSVAGCAIPAYEIGLARWAKTTETPITNVQRDAQLRLWKFLRIIDDLSEPELERRLLSMPMGAEKEKLLQGNYALAVKTVFRWYIERWNYAHGPNSVDRNVIMTNELEEARELAPIYNKVKQDRNRDLPWYRDPLAKEIWKVASEYADVAIVMASSMQVMGARAWDVEQVLRGKGRFEYGEQFGGTTQIIHQAMDDLGVDLAEMVIQKMALNEQHYPLLTGTAKVDRQGNPIDWLTFKYRVGGERRGRSNPKGPKFSFAQRMRLTTGEFSSQTPDLCMSRLGELGLALVDKSPFGSNGSKPKAIYISAGSTAVAGSDKDNHYDGLYASGGGRRASLTYSGKQVDKKVLVEAGVTRRERAQILRLLTGGYIDRLRIIAKSWPQLEIREID